MFEDVFSKWCLKQHNKQANVYMWDAMAQSFGEKKIPSFEDNKFLQLLDKSNICLNDSFVLDVGCGTGNYTLAIAKRCQKVIGLDVSTRMVELAQEKARQEDITNVEFHCIDWHEIDIKKAGLEKRFDLVFAHMTPAVQSAETFIKLLLASRGWCALSKPTRRTDSVSDEVKKLIGISHKNESCDIDVLYAFELLWCQGLMPHIEYEQQHWSMRRTMAEARELYFNRVRTYRDISFEEEKQIIQYLESIASDGWICEEIDTTITTLIWHVKNQGIVFSRN